VTLITGHTRPLPVGRAVARTVLAYGRVFERDVLNQLRHRGTWMPVTLDHWREQFAAALADDLAPFAQRGWTDARQRYAGHPAAWLKVAGFSATALSPELRLAIETLALDLAGSTLATAAFAVAVAIRRLREALRRGLSAGETAQQMTDRVQRIFRDPARARAIALTESSRALHLGQYTAAVAAGVVTKKYWLAASDCCDECEALAAMGPIDLTTPFLVRTTGRPAYRVVMFAPLHPHCRCTMGEVLGDVI